MLIRFLCGSRLRGPLFAAQPRCGAVWGEKRVWKLELPAGPLLLLRSCRLLRIAFKSFCSARLAAAALSGKTGASLGLRPGKGLGD